MALKRKITGDEFNKLGALLKTEYKENPDEAGSYLLEVEGDEDSGALKRAKDHEKEQRKSAEKKVKDLTDQLTELTEERDGLLKGAIPKGDVEKLENSYKKKHADREAELGTQINGLTAQLQTILVDNVAQQMASELSTAPVLLLPHIRSRLKAEVVEGKFVTRVVDAEGKPSALTLADLKKDFACNKDYAAIITGSKASGGGAGGSGGGGAGTGKIDFTKSPGEVAAQLKARGGMQERPGGN